MNEVSSSQNSNSSGRVLAHEVDHNYLQPDRMRNTRRTLSRHQRNADELDPLQGLPSAPGAATAPTISAASTSRLRSSSAASTTTTTTEPTIMQRRTYLSRSTSSSEVTVQVLTIRSQALNGGGARQRSLHGGRLNEPVRKLHQGKSFVRELIACCLDSPSSRGPQAVTTEKADHRSITGPVGER